MHGVCAQEAAERNEFAAASDTRRPWVQTVVLLPWPAGEGHWAVQAVAHEGAEHYCYSPTSRAPVQKVFNIREVGEGGGARSGQLNPVEIKWSSSSRNNTPCMWQSGIVPGAWQLGAGHAAVGGTGAMRVGVDRHALIATWRLTMVGRVGRYSKATATPQQLHCPVTLQGHLPLAVT